MTPLKRGVAAAGAIALLALSLTACGSDSSGASESASKDDYCKAFLDAPQGEDVSADDVHTWAGKLKDVGTPKEISGDARDGFETFVDYASDIKDSDIDKFNGSTDPSDIFGGDDAKKVAAFVSATVGLCVGEVPTDAPT